MGSNRRPDKSDDGGGASLERAAKAFQENLTKAGPLAVASYTLVGAIILFGGIGYAVDRWRDTSPWFLLGGLLLGIVIGFYELAKAVWPARPPRR